MAKEKSVFICRDCGREYPKWTGKCLSCGAWNSLEEITPTAFAVSTKSAPAKPLEYSRITEIPEDSEVRWTTGISELDRVLGGGLVKGSLVLIGGDPGIGKSTLLLQICGHMGNEHTILYVSGEESERQLSLRAKRLGVNAENLFISSCNSCESIIRAVCENKPEAVIIDSIQTITSDALSSSAGSIVQVRECTGAFMRMAKSEEIPVFIVSHVNKDGGIAGPKIMEHIVDTVLYFEGDKQLSFRILRGIKNRFGSTNEIGVFSMDDDGLREVKNPSETMLSGREKNVSGSTVLCAVEGTRPILAEIQALVTRTNFNVPRRTADGFDFNRANLMLAVLEKRGGVNIGMSDAYVNVIGGLQLDEPAADLALVLAAASSFRDKPIDPSAAAIGEVGLTGEIRAVTGLQQRLTEAARTGFKTCIIPRHGTANLTAPDGVELLRVRNIREAIELALA